jgi:IS5 family transposase
MSRKAVRGNEREVFGDAGYQGMENRKEMQDVKDCCSTRYPPCAVSALRW